MTKMRFNSGNPPRPGWHITKLCLGNDFPRHWRWWNGENWSIPITENSTAEQAGNLSTVGSSFTNDYFEWTNYWPENARVPRALK